MSEYEISAERCLTMIGENVCPGCGGKLGPIETEDNSGSPTYWAGCMDCQCFSWGVEKIIHDVAKEMVINRNYVHYSHLGDRFSKSGEDLNRWLISQITGASNHVYAVIKTYEILKSQQQ